MSKLLFIVELEVTESYGREQLHIDVERLAGCLVNYKRIHVAIDDTADAILAFFDDYKKNPPPYPGGH